MQKFVIGTWKKFSCKGNINRSTGMIWTPGEVQIALIGTEAQLALDHSGYDIK
jgi:hypothetical protein